MEVRDALLWLCWRRKIRVAGLRMRIMAIGGVSLVRGLGRWRLGIG